MTDNSRLEGEVDPKLIAQASFIPTKIDEGRIPYPTEIPIPMSDPFSKGEWKHFIPASEPMVFERFISLTEQLLEAAWEADQVESEFVFTAEYPGEEFQRLGKGEVVNWKLMRRAPATTGPGSSGRGLPQSQANIRLRIPETPNKVVEVGERWMDHTVAFTCWATTAREANARVLWLERTLVNSTWALKQQGVRYFQFKGRGPDTYQMTNGVRLYLRTIEFYVTLPEFELKSAPVIQQINISSTPTK